MTTLPHAMTAPLRSLPWAVVRTANAVVEPATRRGWLAPLAVGAGVIRLEAAGRRTGQRRSRPVLAVRLGDHLVVGTVRRRSDWIANLGADPRPSVTLRDGEHVVDARIHRRSPLGALAVLEVGSPDGR